MISEVNENLLASYTNRGDGGNGGRAAGGDAYSDKNNVDRFHNAVIDERPTRDPDLFNQNPPHAAIP
jgi:hypothetical protein